MKEMGSDNLTSWVALHLVPGLGNIALRHLLDKFGDPESILHASLSDLLEVRGLRKEVALSIAKGEFSADPEKTLRKVENYGARIIKLDDPNYPQTLKQIHDPPMLLYVLGNEIPHNFTFLAVVGSRYPTTYGLKAAEKIAKGLAERGIGVVSGMARGIDSAAHWGCIEGNRMTIAVLGTGIDRIYPVSNKKLFQQIALKGAVISEFPMGTPPEPKNFPIRNRIISGLSKGVVVVEATRKSGSLITASLALEQGRDVFAVPGSINSFKSAGCHFLIKQGAILVENSDDILDELGLNYEFAIKSRPPADEIAPSLPEPERGLYDLIGDYPVHIDHIVRQSKMEAGEVSGILMRMELKGVIRQLPGKMFVK